jgi:hypothetical protein
MHLPRIDLCHLIFHYLHYHLVIRDHLLIVLTEFLTLIKSMTIWPLSYVIFLSPLEFEINCSEAILWPISTPFWSTLTNYTLASAFWILSHIYMTRFWTLFKTTTNCPLVHLKPIFGFAPRLQVASTSSLSLTVIQFILIITLAKKNSKIAIPPWKPFPIHPFNSPPLLNLDLLKMNLVEVVDNETKILKLHTFLNSWPSIQNLSSPSTCLISFFLLLDDYFGYQKSCHLEHSLHPIYTSFLIVTNTICTSPIFPNFIKI